MTFGIRGKLSRSKSSTSFSALPLKKASYSLYNPVPQTIAQSGVAVLGKLPIVNILSTPGSLGDLVLSKDGMVYYHNGEKWLSLAIINSQSSLLKITDKQVQLVAPDGCGVIISSGNNATGHGGDVRLASGLGGRGDGRVLIDIGGETVATFTEQGLTVAKITETAALAKEAEPAFETHTVVWSFGESIPTVRCNGSCVINLHTFRLTQGSTVSGTIESDKITVESRISISIASNAGAPLAWTGKAVNGSCQYHIMAVRGDLFDLQAFLTFL